MTKKGFSLIEIVLGMSLFSVLLVTANMVIFSSLKSARKSAGLDAVRREGAYLLDLITKEIQYSSAISQPCNGNTITLTRPDNATLLTFNLDTTEQQMEQGVAVLNSGDVVVKLHPDCATAFTCSVEPNPRYVNVCFAVETSNGADQTDWATSDGTGIKFSRQVLRKN